MIKTPTDTDTMSTEEIRLSLACDNCDDPMQGFSMLGNMRMCATCYVDALDEDA